MSTNGQLVFTDVDKITFKGVGNASNAVIDTLTGKIGVGTDSPEANLHVLGNSYVSTNLELGGTLIMGTVNVEAQHSLEAVTATGNITPLTIEFTNPTTSLVASGNVVVTGNVTADHFVGDGSNITGISSNLDQVVNIGNVTSNTIQFSNAITGFVTTANIEVGTANLFVDTSSSRVGIGTNVPSAPLHVYNNSLGSTTGNSTDILNFGGNSVGAGALLLTAERLSNGSTWTSTGLRLQKIVDVTKMAYVQFGSDTGNASGELLFGTGDATERMRITGGGNVGIGTTSPGAKLHIGAFDNNHLLLTSVNNDYGWKIDTDDQGAGEVPFRLYRRTDTVDVLALSVANQNSRVNHTHTEKYNFHYNAATWGHATNVDSTATNLFSTTINFPYDGYIFVKSQGHWARKDTNNSGHTGGNQSFYAWISLNNQESAWSGQYDNHTGTDTNSYDKFHSYQSPDASGAGSWRNFHYSNFYKVSAGNNTLSIRVNNYFGSGHYLAINGAGISGFYVPKNYL